MLLTCCFRQGNWRIESLQVRRHENAGPIYDTIIESKESKTTFDNLVIQIDQLEWTILWAYRKDMFLCVEIYCALLYKTVAVYSILYSYPNLYRECVQISLLIVS